MKKKTAVFLGISACLILTAFQMYTPKPPVPRPFLPKTFCGVLGGEKIEVASGYFGTIPDYEGITAWGANRLKVNEDCSSKFNRLEIHTNINSGKPSEPFGQRPFDVVIKYSQSNGFHRIIDRAREISEDQENQLVTDNSETKTYETKRNEIGHFSRKIIYLSGGQESHILDCAVNKSGMMVNCNLSYNSDRFDIDVFGEYDLLINTSKIKIFTNSFIDSVRIKGTASDQ